MKLQILQWLYWKLRGLQSGQKFTPLETTRHLLQHTVLLQASEEHLSQDVVSMLQCLHTNSFIDKLLCAKQFLHKGFMPSTRLMQLSQQYGGLQLVCPEIILAVRRLMHSWLLHWVVDRPPQIMHSFCDLLPDFGFAACPDADCIEGGLMPYPDAFQSQPDCQGHFSQARGPAMLSDTQGSETSFLNLQTLLAGKGIRPGL